MKKMSFFCLSLCVLSAAVFSQTAALPKEIRIGIVAPLSGEAAPFGQSAVNGATLLFDRLNRSGGIAGMEIIYLIKDDQSDPRRGAKAYDELVSQDKVSAIIGTVMSRVSLAGAPIAQAAGVPMISPTSTNPAVTAVGDCIFRACFIDPFQGLIAARYAFRTLAVRTAGVLFDQSNDYSRSMAEVFRDEFSKIGGAISFFEGHQAGSRDFKEILSRIKKEDPGVIFIPDYYNDAGRIARQAREAGLSAVLMGGDAWDNPDLVSIGGSAVEGGFFVNHFAPDADLKAVKDFVAEYRQAHSAVPDALAALGYEAAMLVADAVRRAASDDPARVRQALEQTDMELLLGRLRFDRNRNPVKAAVIMEVRRGRFVCADVVAP